MEKETYSLKANCKNCDFNDMIEIQKGRKIEDTDCPTCGCQELEKEEEPLVIRPQYEDYS